MFDKEINCIVCDKPISKDNALKDFGVYFCSSTCLEHYQRELDEVGKNINLDECC